MKVLGRGWVGFDFCKAFGCPVKIVNDAGLGDNSNAFVGGYRLWLDERAVHEGDGAGRKSA